MKHLLVSSLQGIIWSGYSVIVWLSQKDKVYAKGMLFIIFLYVSYLVTKRFFPHKRQAFIVTCMNIGGYFLLQLIVTPLFHLFS
ncbi:hypothetical protein JOC93_001636 [Priestia taiwanensis]|nr:hypothetical protein [Priestia taiwanensis]